LGRTNKFWLLLYSRVTVVNINNGLYISKQLWEKISTVSSQKSKWDDKG
jgi:hypothetical protein